MLDTFAFFFFTFYRDSDKQVSYVNKKESEFKFRLKNKKILLF